MPSTAAIEATLYVAAVLLIVVCVLFVIAITLERTRRY